MGVLIDYIFIRREYLVFWYSYMYCPIDALHEYIEWKILNGLTRRLQIRCQNRSSASGCRDPAFQRITSPGGVGLSPYLVSVDYHTMCRLLKNNSLIASVFMELQYRIPSFVTKI
jgi:hypothetical protein